MTIVTDKRGEERPERKAFAVYPRCKTCKHFDNFVNSQGMATTETICVIDPPVSQAQIRGEDDQRNVIWSSWHGWPIVNEFQRCGKHQAADAN